MPPSSEPPVFWIFAGPNGSGKSTAYARTNPEGEARPFWIINPDALTLEIVSREGLTVGDANLEAVKRLEAWLEATVLVHRSLGVETVLSTSKYRRLVTLAKSRGYRINLFYVILDSPQRNVERVRRRFAAGGHDVPEQKIVDRYWRSLEQMPWFLDQADRAWINDNSGAEVVLVAEKENGVVHLYNETIPAVVRAIRSVQQTG